MDLFIYDDEFVKIKRLIGECVFPEHIDNLRLLESVIGLERTKHIRDNYGWLCFSKEPINLIVLET